jgi:hypothetical protein
MNLPDRKARAAHRRRTITLQTLPLAEAKVMTLRAEVMIRIETHSGYAADTGCSCWAGVRTEPACVKAHGIDLS